MPVSNSLSNCAMCRASVRFLAIAVLFFVLMTGAMSFGLVPDSIGGILP